MKKYLVVLICVMFSTLCNGQKLIGDQPEIEKILTNIESFSGYVMASDYQKLGDAYTEDGKIFPNNREIIEGQGPIMGYWTLPEGMRISYHKIFPKEIKIIGEEAYDYGLYEGTTKYKDGNEVSWKGKYVIIWKKVEDDWKIYLDIWNRIEEKN